MVAFFVNCHDATLIDEVRIQTANVPSLTTASITEILFNSAKSGGNVNSDGGTPIIARGIVWSTSTNPTITLSTKTTDGTGAGLFSSNISGLTANSTFKVRAYATNSVGTAYGNELTFTTTAILTFNTVIGANGRIWMDRNLGASRVAISSTDSAAYGNLYLWGRSADGHQIRTSINSSILSILDVSSHSNFTLTTNSPYDWRSPQNNNLWYGLKWN